MAQVDPDSTSFISPVNHTIKLSGSFAELRSNHFHAGIDIKSTKGVEGDPILASEAGFISRIKVESSGYGKALYIDHPNGYTTVYAHLAEFHPDVERYVKMIQNKIQNFSVDIYLDEEKFSFVQGQEIGLMGNTGRSYAPHLHFEIRETITERPVLPSQFNIKTKDSLAPVISNVYIYELDEYGNTLKKFQVRVAKEKGAYKIKPENINVNSNLIGIGIVTYDQSNGQHNKNGVYKLNVSSADKSFFHAQFDKLDFSQSKAINSVIDYEHYTRHGQKILKLFASECSPLANYNQQSGYGYIPLTENIAQKINVTVEDDYANQSSFSVQLHLQSPAEKEQKEELSLIECGVKDTLFLSSGAQLALSEKSLYQKQEVKFRERSEGSYRLFDITNNGVPAHEPFKLSIPNVTGDRWILTKVDNKGRRVNFGGYTSENMFIIFLDEFGTYRLEMDKIPPSITRKAVTTKNSSKQYIFTVNDNLKYDSGLHDISISCEACGKWILHNFDKKNNEISVDISEAPQACSSLNILIKDFSGNQTSLNQSL